MPVDPNPPPDDALLPYITSLRAANPSLGVSKLLALLKSEQPEWLVSEKRLRKALQAVTQNGGASNGSESNERGLVATTSLDSSLASAITTLAPKVKIRMFGGEKGKGLVARDKILQGEVIWQEEPWIVTSSPQLYSVLLSKKMCSHCYTLFSRPSPPLSVSCPHCDQVSFCNRLCYSKANSSASHPDLLCPGVNPAAETLWETIRRSNGRYLETVAKILAIWRIEREKYKGRAKEIESRVWSMARVSLEDKEKEKKEWELFGELKRGEWAHAHRMVAHTLNPTVEDKSHKPFQKALAKIIKKQPTPLTVAEQQRWFSLESFLELLGLAGLNSEDSGGLYALHAHLNHSCEPNVAALNLPKSFSPPSTSDLPCQLPDPSQLGRGTNKLTLLARRTINPGEELFIPYVNFNMLRSDRRAMLRELYGFWCDCPKCKRQEGKEGERDDDMLRRNREQTEEMIEKMKTMPMFTNMQDKGGEGNGARRIAEPSEDGGVQRTQVQPGVTVQ